MSVSFTIQGASQTFPAGLEVHAYNSVYFGGPAPLLGQAPGGAPVATSATVEERGHIVFAGLEPATRYYAGAEVNGVWNWVVFFTNPAGSGGGEGPEGARGPEGKAGPAGPTGPEGKPGGTGPSGPEGKPGGTGATGPAGPEGGKGPRRQTGTALIGSVVPRLGLAVDKSWFATEAGARKVTLEHADCIVSQNSLKMATTFNEASAPAKVNVKEWRELTALVGPKVLQRGHCVIWGNQLGAWCKNTLTKAEMRTAIERYAKGLAEETAGVIDVWDVLNECIADGGSEYELKKNVFTEVFGSQVISTSSETCKFYAEVFKWMHAAAPSLALAVTDYRNDTEFNFSFTRAQVEAASKAENETKSASQKIKGTMQMKLVEVLLELEAPVTHFGMQGHRNTKEQASEGDMKFVAAKTRALSTPIEPEVTECDIVIEAGDSEQTQAAALAKIATGAREAGYGRVVFWTLSANHEEGGERALFNASFEPKPAVGRIVQALRFDTPVAPQGMAVREITASGALIYADIEKVIRCNSASEIKVEVPKNATVAFPIGTIITIRRQGTGVLEVTKAAGVTVNSASGTFTANKRWSNLVLHKEGTDEWNISGDLT